LPRWSKDFDMPRALPDALLEGLAWDAMGRRYRNLADLHAYSARVASAVGVMMCVLMRVRSPDALARAADLGLAMQLTNIARDVGEDARAGRLFLPLDWLEEAGIDPERFLADPRPSAALAGVVRRLLDEADELYLRAATGVSSLPADCRLGIAAARHIYAAIGTEVARAVMTA
jgi:15-cis-phytoene synthase